MLNARRALLFSLSVLLAGSLACQPSAAPAKPGQPGVAPAAPAGSPQTGGRLRVGLNADFTTLDPHLSTAAVDRQVYQSIYNTLVRLDP